MFLEETVALLASDRGLRELVLGSEHTSDRSPAPASGWSRSVDSCWSAPRPQAWCVRTCMPPISGWS